MFRSSLPVTETSFLDREEAMSRLEELAKRLASGAPEWLAIIGPRKVGKTSLLLEAARRFRRDDLGFVVFDVFDAMPVALDVFRQLLGRILDAVFGEDAGVALSRLLARPQQYRAALLRSTRYRALDRELQTRLLEIPERELDASFVRDAIDLPEEIAAKTAMRLVIAIDEFQELAGVPVRKSELDLLPLIRARWQRHRRIAYVISGSARSTLTNLVTQQHSPFFQHFALLELGPFSREEAVRLLTQAAPEDRPIVPELAERAVDILDGHPFYLQLFGEALTSLSPPYDERALKQALQETLFSRTGRLALYFQNNEQQLVGRSTGLLTTLEALADGAKTTTELARAIGGSTGTANQYLQRLGDAVRTRGDRRHELADPVFAAWVRWRAPGGSAVPMKVIGDEAEAAVGEHLARMGFELIYFSRGSRGAFDLLAVRGADQLGVQVKRSALPLRFSKSAWNRMSADAKRLRWRWIIAAVAPIDGTIALLDPRKANRRAEVRLGPAAAIENLLAWLS
jgi:AAA+ ATPase superfamily predicted ATPase